jgi:hypothetical protein
MPLRRAATQEIRSFGSSWHLPHRFASITTIPGLANDFYAAKLHLAPAMGNAPDRKALNLLY